MAHQLCEIDGVLLRVRGEYLEMPGLRLTPEQVQRLLGLDGAATQAVITELVEAKFLRRTPGGALVRADSDCPRC